VTTSVGEGRGRRRSVTIIVADDDATIVALAAVLLRDQGYRVLEAHSAHQALRLAELNSTPVDVLLTDIEMPEMDGLALWESLRSRHAEMHVVFMSGGVKPESDAAFLLKPFTLGELVHTVEGTLR
jgi:two-component system cell cycle sensor histidine kinase/response regulator CckA